MSIGPLLLQNYFRIKLLWTYFRFLHPSVNTIIEPFLVKFMSRLQMMHTVDLNPVFRYAQSHTDL